MAAIMANISQSKDVEVLKNSLISNLEKAGFGNRKKTVSKTLNILSSPELAGEISKDRRLTAIKTKMENAGFGNRSKTINSALLSLNQEKFLISMEKQRLEKVRLEKQVEIGKQILDSFDIVAKRHNDTIKMTEMHWKVNAKTYEEDGAYCIVVEPTNSDKIRSDMVWALQQPHIKVVIDLHKPTNEAITIAYGYYFNQDKKFSKEQLPEAKQEVEKFVTDYIRGMTEGQLGVRSK